jgi:transcriptional regulator with XRE-family HTH domain
MNVAKRIGKKLRNLRTAKGVSQYKVSDETVLSKRQSRILNVALCSHLRVLIVLADYFEVPLAEIFSEVDEAQKTAPNQMIQSRIKVNNIF